MRRRSEDRQQNATKALSDITDRDHTGETTYTSLAARDNHSKLWSMITVLLMLLLPITTWSAPKLAGISLGYPSAPSLTRSMSTAPSFYRNVGGVAFSQVAEGRDDAVVTGLYYDSKRPDGERLRVTVRSKSGKRTVTAQIHDWQLRPIAEFADSPHHAAVTLFGKLTSDRKTEKARSAGKKIINYHPAFQDRLMGLRLLQLDMLVIHPSSVEVFREKGKYIIEDDEAPINVAVNTRAFKTVSKWMMKQPEKFQSYVVSDREQDICFFIENDQLSFTGTMYWDTWRSNPNFSHDDLEMRVNDRLKQEFENDSRKMNQKEFSKKYTTAYQQRRGAELADKLGKNGIIIMETYGEQLSSLVDQVGGINPTIYQAGRNTMHYAALFRHFKKRDKAAYTRFLRQVKRAKVRKVKTPTTIMM